MLEESKQKNVIIESSRIPKLITLKPLVFQKDIFEIVVDK